MITQEGLTLLISHFYSIRVHKIFPFNADGEDFLSRAVSLTFSLGNMRVCFNTTILDDSHYELREKFFVNISTSNNRVDIMPSTSATVVTILDDESEFRHCIASY